MNRPTGLIALALGAAFLLVGCCGDLTKSESVRKSFVQQFNDNQDLESCSLAAGGEDATELTLTCGEQDLTWIEKRVKPVCSSFQPFGFTAMKAVGKDGEANVAVNADCAFTTTAPAEAAAKPGEADEAATKTDAADKK